MTIDEQERLADHAAAVAELKRQRAAAMAKLDRLETKLSQLDQDDFQRRIGALKVSQMTVAEKSEIVRRRGYAGFKELVTGGR